MDVPDQFQQVRVLLTQDGLVAVLKKMAAAMVAEVIADGVSRQEPLHHGGQRGSARSQQEMKVIGNQGPSIAGGLGFDENFPEAMEEIFPVGITQKDLLPGDSASDDMMQCVGGVYPFPERHLRPSVSEQSIPPERLSALYGSPLRSLRSPKPL